MATPLSDIEVRRELGRLTGWSRRGDVITRSFEFPDFPSAIAFVGRVAEAAERLHHHPDIDIRYTRVTCALTTHSAGGITRRDFDLAAAIDAAFGAT